MPEATPIILAAGPVIMGRHDIAQGIANYYGVRPVRLAPDAPAGAYVAAMQPALDREHPAVLDGTWLDDYVMACACRVRRHVNNAQIKLLNRLAMARGGVLIVARTSLRTYLVNIANMSPLSAELVNRAFNVFYEWEDLETPLPICFPNIHVESLQESIVPNLDNLLQETNIGPGIGHWNPGKSVLLVGDRHGPSLQPYNVKLNVAFVSLSGVGCSEWLAEQIQQERNLYWVNAYGKGGEEVSADFVSKLRPKAVVAMGGAAELWCDKNKLQMCYDVHRVPHPQYWKRFHFTEPYPLKDILINIR